jgi:hypothetical protein
MTELTFARQFLSALDSRSIKLSADHISDPRQLPASVAVCFHASILIHTNSSKYTIPKYPSSPAKRKRAAADSTSGSATSLTITLKNLKSPAHSLSLSDQAPTSSVFDLKKSYADTYSLPLDKIKLLYAKKPASDAKTLSEILGADAVNSGNSEFTVMLLGGAVPKDKAEATAAASQEEGAMQVDEKTESAHVGPSGKELLATDEFWDDLKGFLTQRLKDQAEGERLAQVFRKAAS